MEREPLRAARRPEMTKFVPMTIALTLTVVNFAVICFTPGWA